MAEVAEVSVETFDSSATDHIEVIETVIASLDSEQTAMVSHTEAGHFWKFTYGTVEVRVKLSGRSESDTLMVWATVLTLPAQNELQLMQKLLKMNWAETFEARFGIVDDEVVVIASRSVADLSPGEISRIMTIVATIADEVDEPLQAEYGSA